jgi:hypothetical protein
MEICFWFDPKERKLHVVHRRSGESCEIDHPRKIVRFLTTYGLNSHDCTSFQNGEDRLHLFKRMKIAPLNN